MPTKIKVKKLVLNILLKVWRHTFNADLCVCLSLSAHSMSHSKYMFYRTSWKGHQTIEGKVKTGSLCSKPSGITHQAFPKKHLHSYGFGVSRCIWTTSLKLTSRNKLTRRNIFKSKMWKIDQHWAVLFQYSHTLILQYANISTSTTDIKLSKLMLQ